MAGNSPLKQEPKIRRNIILPAWLDKELIKSAENTNRSYSGMVVTILKGAYGDRKK